MDVGHAAVGADERAVESRSFAAAGLAAASVISPNGSAFRGASNAVIVDLGGALQPEQNGVFAKGTEHGEPHLLVEMAPMSIEPAPSSNRTLHGAVMADVVLSDSAFAASMASFTSDLQAELSRLTTANGPVASLEFDQPSTQEAMVMANTNQTDGVLSGQCTSCFALLEMAFPEAYTATTATFCLCCRRPLPLPAIEYVQEEDAAFPRCGPCMLARLPTKPVVEEEWWPTQYKHALLRAVESKLWCKLIEVGNLPQSGESARHQLYHRRNQLENAQRVHEHKTLEAVRGSEPLTREIVDGLFREWRDLQAREDAENFRIIVLLSKCLQEIGRGVPPEVGEALQLCRGRDIRSEHQAAKLASSLLIPVQCGCCPAVLSIPAPSGVPLPNPCFCFCCARMVPESLMYQPENASRPTSGDLCLDCAAAHDDLERKWFLVSASPTMVDWRRHKVVQGLERQLKRVRDSTAAAYKAGCDSEKDIARWRVADGAAIQWQSRTEKIRSEQRAVLRRGWTPVADSRQSYSAQAEYEKKFVVAIPPLLKVLANLLVRQRIALGGDDAHTALKRSDSMDEPRSDERDLKVRKF